MKFSLKSVAPVLTAWRRVPGRACRVGINYGRYFFGESLRVPCGGTGRDGRAVVGVGGVALAFYREDM